MSDPQQSADPGCLTADRLHDFLLGKLPPAEVAAYCAHIDTCTRCQTVLDKAEPVSDAFIDNLNRSPSPDPLLDERECGTATSFAKSLGEREAAASSRGPVPQRNEPPEFQQLGPYRLEEQLGAGAMGMVFKATHTRLKRRVALKVMTSGRWKDPEAIARFQREMTAVGQLDHPHIVQATDANQDGEVHYLAMEFLHGMDLSRLQRRLGQVPLAEACEIARQAALGLQYAHERQLVHRDIKPGNLMLAVADGRSGDDDQTDDQPLPPMVVKILDLGLALVPRETSDDEITGTGQVMGTVDYMAPEQFEDTHGVDIRADIYSLGATLFKLLTGRAPFDRAEFSGRLSKLVAMAQNNRPSIRTLRPDLPKGLSEIVDRMLSREPADRFATPAAVAAALAPFSKHADLPRLFQVAVSQADRPAAETSDAVRQFESRSGKRMHRGVAVGLTACVAAVALCAAVGWAVMNWNAASSRPATLPPPPTFEFRARILPRVSASLQALAGSSVAMDGDLAVVGAPAYRSTGFPLGAAFVLTFDENSWRRVALLLPENSPPPTTGFGRSVAISGSRVVVGAEVDGEAGVESGAAFVFAKNAAGWQLEQKILPPVPVQAGLFGRGVAIEGDWLLIGCRTNSKGSEGGCVYAYHRTKNDGWQLRRRLLPKQPTHRVGFGAAVAMHGGQVVVGGTNNLVYTYRRRDQEWLTGQVLTIAEIGASTQFGAAVAIRDDRILIGARQDHAGDSLRCGAAYVFAKGPDGWTLEQKLIAPQPATNDYFGSTVAIDQSRLLIGQLPTSGQLGRVHLFEPDADQAGRWTARRSWVDDAGGRATRFGVALAIGNGRVLIGAPHSDGKAYDDGRVFTFIERDGHWVSSPNTWSPAPTVEPGVSPGAFAGHKIAAGDDLIAVAAPGIDLPGAKNAGAVQLFVPGRGGGSSSNSTTDPPVTQAFDYLATLTADDPREGTQFGSAMGVQGDTLVIGTGAEAAGAVSVFRQSADDSTGWRFQQQITPPRAADVARFGKSVALSGDVLVVGAATTRERPGSVFLFERRDGRFEFQQEIQAEDATVGDEFGAGLQLAGDLLAVGAPNARQRATVGAGAVYLFRRQNNAWVPQQRLTASRIAAAARFGSTLALSADWLAVGAPLSSDTHDKNGAVFVFARNGDQWTQRQQLLAYDASAKSEFGCSLALANGLLLIGSGDDSEHAPEGGAAYLFYFDGRDWVQHQKLVPPQSVYKQKFGRATRIHGDQVFIGASGENNYSGAVYVFGPQ